MHNFIVVILFSIVMTGCANTSNRGSIGNAFNNSGAIDEGMLIKSSNYNRLIELYRDQLAKRENSQVRYKLAKAYVDNNDNESAIFTLQPLLERRRVDSDVLFLSGLAHYNLGNLDSAYRAFNITLEKKPDSAKAYNMTGIIYAHKNELTNARTAFNRARSLMYDDITIKNNLAMLDLIEGKYEDAADKLLPLYLNSRGTLDESVKANLAMTMAKLGNFDYLASLYADKYSRRELLEAYKHLKVSEVIKSSTSTEQYFPGQTSLQQKNDQYIPFSGSKNQND